MLRIVMGVSMTLMMQRRRKRRRRVHFVPTLAHKVHFLVYNQSDIAYATGRLESHTQEEERARAPQ
eukprot:4521643-Pyramimonas_sp.AAC.1